MTGLWSLTAVSLTMLCLVFWFASDASAQEPPAIAVMVEANSRYERGEFAEAAQQYEDLLANGYGDTALYYNLGNSYLQGGDFGRAILNYLRAEELSPRNPDVRANLDRARSMTLDQIETERDSLVESVSYLGRRWMTPGELGAVALLLWTVASMAIGALLVWRSTPSRIALRIVAGIMSVATLLSLALLLSMIYANPYDNTGVVTVETVDALSGPGFQYPEAFTLRSGAQVRLVDSQPGWLRVALPGGELRGWTPAHTVEAVGRADDG